MRKILSGVLAAALSAVAVPATAFGPACVPVPQNCFCTYQVPCPVVDLAANARHALENSRLKKALQLMEDIRAPKEKLLRAVSGEGSLSVPGLNSIGIDLNAIRSADLTGLGIPGPVTSLADNLSDIGIDTDMIEAMASGKLAPADFVEVARNAGVDFAALEQAGLSADTVTALANGDLGTQQIFDIAENVGLEGNVLSNIGITPEIVQQVAGGQVQPGRILAIAENAGLDIAALERVGLDRATITELGNGAGPEAVMSILQNAGYDSSPLADLGIDAGQLGRIASGDLPPDAIKTLVQGTGIAPSGIVIPGKDGPVRLDGERPRSQFGMVAIPAKTVPGLENVLAQARGNASPVKPAETAASSRAACSADRSLIAHAEPPNGFGSDVPNIDMAISGSNLTTFPEARTEARMASTRTLVTTAGRAITTRPLLASALESVDSFQTMMKQTKTVQDDIAINDTVRTRLMTARAETASMLTALVSVRAARRVIDDRHASPVPLFPQNSRFRNQVRQRVRATAQESTEASEALRSVAADQGALHQRASELFLHHNMTRDITTIRAGIPSLMETIEHHERQKSFLVYLEDEIIKPRLDELYVGGADAAWPALRRKLYATKGDYMDADKYIKGDSDAEALSRMTVRQAATTELGERRVERTTFPGRPDRTQTLYTKVSFSPDSYERIDSYAGSRNEPYKVQNIPGTTNRPGDENTTPRRGYEMAMAYQYYLEVLRRMEFAAVLRRGDSQASMTSKFWQEMLGAAPRCISGPRPFTRAAARRRPELFDLDPECDHLTWANADAGDYIDSRELGGADAALWLSKISLDRVRRRTGGPEQIKSSMRALLDDARRDGIVAKLTMLGHTDSAAQSRAVLQRLRSAIADTDFQRKIAFPDAGN